MEDLKKRKLRELEDYGSVSTVQHLVSLLEPLSKPQLVDLLSKLGSQYHFIAEEIKSIASEDPVHRKLFVRGLAWNTTSETLCDAFQIHGEIEEGAVIYDKATGKSRGYGFITYKNMESTQTALKAPSKMIDGRLAVCNLACEGLTGASLTPDLAQRKLYIGGLAPGITSEILLGFFERHGDIEEGSVAYDKDTNESRGFGFVTYKTVESAKSALDDRNKMLGGSNVIVKLADSHRGKIILGQVPSAASPMALPMVASYPQPGKAQAMAAFGYTYPQALPPYATSYPSPSMGHMPFASQPQLHYPPAPRKKEAFGLQSTTTAGVGGYPYYYYTK